MGTGTGSNNAMSLLCTIFGELHLWPLFVQFLKEGCYRLPLVTSGYPAADHRGGGGGGGQAGAAHEK